MKLKQIRCIDYIYMNLVMVYLYIFSLLYFASLVKDMAKNKQRKFQMGRVSPWGWSGGLLRRYWIRKAAVSQHLLVSLKSVVTPFTEQFKLGLGQWLPEGVQAYWKGKKWLVWDDQIIQRASVKRWCVIMWTAVLNRRLE